MRYAPTILALLTAPSLAQAAGVKLDVGAGGGLGMNGVAWTVEGRGGLQLLDWLGVSLRGVGIVGNAGAVEDGDRRFVDWALLPQIELNTTGDIRIVSSAGFGVGAAESLDCNDDETDCWLHGRREPTWVAGATVGVRWALRGGFHLGADAAVLRWGDPPDRSRAGTILLVAGWSDS